MTTADGPTLTIARLSRVLENHGTSELSMPQYRVLGLLSSGHERATELASKLAVTKPTLTSLIDGLVERGYVERAGADGDRRAVRLVITPAGLDAVGAAGRALREVLDDVLERCADPDGVLIALDDLRLALDARWSERAAAALAAAGARAT
ncbi:MAG TPA: MarR family transcriptional regulator [Ilumatobacteraceae bacterium]|jgi:DNA-binding MarR family transcriptional regulator|nr:MarR family transcriptional regulator [Ilumatobacteraceae bacterium]